MIGRLGICVSQRACAPVKMQCRPLSDLHKIHEGKVGLSDAQAHRSLRAIAATYMRNKQVTERFLPRDSSGFFLPTQVKERARVTAVKLFEGMARIRQLKGTVGLLSYSEVARTFGQLGAVELMHSLLADMRKHNVRPNGQFYLILCSSSAKKKNFDRFLEYLLAFLQLPESDRLTTDFVEELQTYSVLIKLLLMQGPRHFAAAATVRNILQESESLHIGLSCGAKLHKKITRIWMQINIQLAKTPDEAWGYIAPLRYLNYELSSYFSICEKHCDVRALQRGLTKLKYVPNGDDRILITHIMKVYAAVGDVDSCAAWMAKIPHPDEHVYLAMTQACVKAGDSAKAKAVYHTALMSFPSVSFWIHYEMLKFSLATDDHELCDFVYSQMRPDADSRARLPGRLLADGVTIPETFSRIIPSSLTRRCGPASHQPSDAAHRSAVTPPTATDVEP
eukprot:TRINITY_DN13440_c0_g1_i1.p1 TRINITY_DN13440_c0_g1~~TRINITY_DN13440_c0_g1_i1.p1  ORF type:complete len:480 (+),score=27.64 TRINITY_DN13440_c0_g1_i1:91-1440(+)